MVRFVDDSEFDICLSQKQFVDSTDHRKIDVINIVLFLGIGICELLERILRLPNQFGSMSGPQHPVLRGIQHPSLIESVDRLDAGKRFAACGGDDKQEPAAWFLCEVRNDVGYCRLLELVVPVLNTDSAHWRSRGRGIVRAPSTSVSCCWGAPLSFS